MTAQAWCGHSTSFAAMNTRVEFRLYAADGAAGDGVQRMFRQAEACMSRFDQHSELSRLNRSAGHPQRLSPALYDVVETALWAAGITAGLFDPTRLDDLAASGYDRSFEQLVAQPLAPAERGVPVATAAPLTWRVASEPARPRYPDVHLHRPRREVTLPAGVQLDLGGIGKGWTVDRAADWLADRGPFLINAGGDLYAYGAPPDQAGWIVGIVDPWRPEADIATVRLRQRALATSTIARRRWRRGDQMMHHLIDPRTGQPAASDAVSVTVIAARTALAEIYAKAALILGTEASLPWLNCVPEVEALLVRSDGQLLFTEGFDHYMEASCDDLSASH